MYILVDEDEPEDWRYLFIPDDLSSSGGGGLCTGPPIGESSDTPRDRSGGSVGAG